MRGGKRTADPARDTGSTQREVSGSVSGWLASAALYMVTALAFVIAVNADQAHGAVSTFVLAAAALALGWSGGAIGSSGIVASALLPIVLIVLALPFGDVNRSTGGDDLHPVAVIAVVPALGSALIVLVAAGCSFLYRKRRATKAPT